jgi:hypothetical protein
MLGTRRVVRVNALANLANTREVDYIEMLPARVMIVRQFTGERWGVVNHGSTVHR